MLAQDLKQRIIQIRCVFHEVLLEKIIVEDPSYHDGRSMGEHAFFTFSQSVRNSLIKLDKFCQSTREQAQDTRAL